VINIEQQLANAATLQPFDQPQTPGPSEQWLTTNLPPVLDEGSQVLHTSSGVHNPFASRVGSPSSRPDEQNSSMDWLLAIPTGASSSLASATQPLAGLVSTNPWESSADKATSNSIMPTTPPRQAGPSANRQTESQTRGSEALANLRDRLQRAPRRNRFIALATAVLSVSALGIGVRVLSPSGAGWAAAWDPTILPLAKQTEALRGLKFSHPVRVEFLSSATFDASTLERRRRAEREKGHTWNCWKTTDHGGKFPMCAFTSPYLAEVSPDTSANRALGVPEGAPAPFAGYVNDETDTLVVARYLFEEHRIEVRGPYSPGIEPVLVHELTHVLQHQHFAMSFKGKNQDQALAFRSLIEGDATLNEERYRDSLPEAQQQLVDEAEAQRSSDATTRLLAVTKPRSWHRSARRHELLLHKIDLKLFPYIQGAEFAANQWERLGSKGYNQLFKSPPKSTASILYPGRDPGIGGEKVTPSAPVAGRPQYGKNEVYFGPLLLFVAMERTGTAADAQLVASGWRGESTSVFEDRTSRRVCFSSDLLIGGDSATLARGALAGWASQRGMTTKFVGEIVHLEACDPFGTV
jgi:hypothetical protein